MPNTIVASSADGYYVKHAKVLRYAGELNLAGYSNLDATSVAGIDPNVLQAYYTEVDRFVDFLAGYVYGWMLPAGETHYVPTGHALFGVLSDAASQYAIPQVYDARGKNDEGGGDKGKMEDKEQEYEARIREILERGAEADGVEEPGVFQSGTVAYRRTCPGDEFAGLL